MNYLFLIILEGGLFERPEQSPSPKYALGGEGASMESGAVGSWCRDTQFETGLGWGACDKCVVLPVGRQSLEFSLFVYNFFFWGGSKGMDGEDIWVAINNGMGCISGVT